jgi:phosphonate transport system substrate-binding protein
MKLKLLTLLTVIAGICTNLAVAQSKAGGLPSKIVVALKPDKNPDQMLAEKRALEKFLSDKLKVPAEVIIPLSSAVILEGFANGTIDLGYLSATDMVHARARKSADLLLAGELEGKTYYKSYWLALKDKPYTSVKELRGKPVAFASKTSTSGYIVPLWNLREQGLIGENDAAEDFFGPGNVFFGSGYVSAVERVLAGEVEAAAVSYYVLDKDKHLSAEQRAKLKKVAEQGPVPTHVIAVRASIGDEQKGFLQAALNGLNSPENTELRDKLFTSKIVSVDPDKHLASLTKALRFAVPGK